MPGGVEMFGCVLVLRRIAATHVAADHTQPQVNPCVVHFQTLLAAVGMRLYVFDLVEMGTGHDSASHGLIAAARGNDSWALAPALTTIDMIRRCSMDNEQNILQAVENVWPRWISNAQLRSETGIKPHQQIFQLTRKLVTSGHIRGERRGREWFFSALRSPQTQPTPIIERNQQSNPINSHGSFGFESSARPALASFFGVPLNSGKLLNVPKKFDLVSADGEIAGDAKYFDLVRGENLPREVLDYR
jgi:hypothetical protein